MDTATPTIDHLIEHQVAELRRRFPRVLSCRTRMDAFGEGLTSRYSLELDIRLPERQCLIAGEARHDAHAAVYSAFEQAQRRLRLPDMNRTPGHRAEPFPTA